MKTFDTDQSNLVGNLPRVTNKFTGNLVKVDRKPSQGNTVKTQKPCEGDSRTLTRFSVKFFLFLFFIPAVLLCQVQKSEKYELRKEQVYSTPQLAGSNATTKPYFQPMTKSAAFNSNVRPMDIKSESVSNEAPISNAVLSAKISKSMSMTPQGIVYNGIDNQFSPQIAVDGNEMFTAFVNNDTTGGYPYGKVSIYKSTDGGTSWTKWTSIFSSAASLENPKICLAGNQVIISFIYVQYLGTYRFDRTTKDGLFTYVSSPTITATDYVVGQQLCTDAVQYPTTPYIYLTYLFRQSDGSTAVLFSRSIDTARTWEDYQSLGYTTPALSTPTVGMDFGSSGLFVSYLGSGTNTGTIMIRKSTIYGSGSSWSSEVSIPLNVNGGPNAKIGPLVSTVGLRVAIVYQYDYSNNAVDYKTATDFDINGLLSSDGGVTWREVLVAGSSSNEILPTITHDVDFSFYVGFMRNNRMCVAMAGNELAFSTPDSSSSTNASMNYFPGIAGSSISGTRQAYAVWTGINTDADIYNSVVSLKIPPLSPTNLITTAASASQVNLIWTDNSSDETGFRIKWSTSASSVYTNSATVGANISSYQVTGLNPSTQYDFFVQAYNANGNSPGAVGSATTSSSGNPPTITSFSPTSGPIGTTVTITGTNFSATASNNIVFFGGIKASVTNATATSLAVTVPSGAVYAPITVTTNNLSASSRLFYTPTFSGNWSLTSTSFAAKTDVNTTGQSFSVAEGDLDGDGKLDLVASNYSGGSVSVFLNTSSSGSITYATKVDFNTGNAPYTVALGDIDGDGKLDIVTTNNSSNTISVLRNTSTPGNLSFASNVDFAMGSNPWGVALADLDGDGKLDVIASGNGSNISVLRNTSSVGTISFAAFQSFGTNVYAWTLAVGDFDGDGKIDVAAASCVNSIVSVFRNTSAVGSISLATNSDYSINSTGSAVAIGDLDGDGKLDIVAGTSSSNTQLSVLLNTSSSGAISFASKVGFTGTQPFGVALGDLDGNGKIDIAATNYNGSTGNTISVFRSNSTSGNAGFEAALNFTSGTGPRAILIGDLDGDGKPDLITANSSSTLSIFRNTVSSNTTPAAPQNLTATAGNGQVTLKWNKNTEADFLKYRIYMGTDSTSVNLKDSSSASISDTSKTIIGLTNGTKYYFRVSALNSARLESGKSVAASSIPNVITLCVSTAGSDANSGTATAPLRNIQTALTRAAIGDTIKVTRGSYSEVMTTQKQVVVRGGYQELFSETNRDIFLNKTYVR
ncbi:MAG: FG-GAP-like repeat-containing protein, partial [Ignavibacteriales bacterium]|nr:FG-GAP-like repeat-containing protein [Ignavibacteriales bacterium]